MISICHVSPFGDSEKLISLVHIESPLFAWLTLKVVWHCLRNLRRLRYPMNRRHCWNFYDAHAYKDENAPAGPLCKRC
jgi:hypothetical protein